MSQPLRCLATTLFVLVALAPAALAQPEEVDLTADDETTEADEEPAETPSSDAPAAQPAAEDDSEEAPVVEDEAAESLRSTIRVIQQRPVLKRLRLELQAEAGTGLDDRMYKHSFVTAMLRFNINEDWSIGAVGNYYFTKRSELFDDVTTDFEVFPEVSRIEWFGGLDLSWTPIHGKFTLGQAIVPFDIATLIGGGVTETTRSTDLKPTIVLGLAWRVYVTKWLAIVTEVRDHIFIEKFNAGDEIVNHVTIQAGLSLFIPFRVNYRFPR